MASLGHIIVGCAGARLLERRGVIDAAPSSVGLFMGGLCVLSLLPDADVVAFALGIPYEAPWGHRGASHSILFSAGLGLLVFAAFYFLSGRRSKRPVFMAAIFTVIAISHGLLDCFTDGGLGIALLWPFSDARFFAPIQPIPVAPIGWYFFSARGMYCAFVELVLFAPLLLYALWPRRSPFDKEPAS